MKIQNKIKCYVFLIALSFLCVSKVYASLEISQIMYDPEGTDTNREWVKLYNNGEENININIIGGQTKSAWRISGGETKESLHYINEDLDIPIGMYAVITKNKDIFKQEYPSFSGPVTTASISFNNTAGIVKIWDGNDPRNLIASKEYSASEDVSTTDNTDTTDENDSGSSTANTSIISPSKEKIIVYPIETKIISQKTVVAGLAFLINSETFGTKKEEKILGRFVWNFGDGNVKEEAVSNPFEYIYEYPGDYILTLSYFDTHFSVVPEATDRMIIKVVPSQMTISSVGGIADPFIELENKSPYEINLSKWQILSMNHSFIFPEGIIVLPNKKLKLSPKVTGFNFNDLQSLTLKNPSSEIVFSYPQKKSYTSNTSSINSYKKAPANLDDVNSNTNTNESNIINLNDLEASAVKSSMNLNVNYYLVALFFVIGVGIASVFLLKKKDNIKHDGVEGQITANDIKIIE